MQRHFDDQMKDLLQRLVQMGQICESMTNLALKTLIERDEKYVVEVKAKELEINKLEMEVDDSAVKLTALQQPVATDVRFLFMATRIASELERIADQAINICESAHYVLEAPQLKAMIDIPPMAKVAQRMVIDALEALVKRDCDLARQVFKDEEKVDAYKDQVFRALLTYMMSEPATIPRALSLILISRNIERIGDHATNIAEEVIYLVKGRDVRHQDIHHKTSSTVMLKITP
jgi:phosphate transport system protein